MLRLNTFSTLPTSKLAIVLAVLPLGISTAYLVYLNRLVTRQCTISTGRRDKKRRINTLSPNLRRPTTLPQEVDSDESEWVLAYERVTSQPLDPTNLLFNLEKDLSTALTRYIRTTMTAFSWTPQAFILRASVGDNAARKTFDIPFIQNLEFLEGDRVNGCWKVVYRGDQPACSHWGERIEMALDAPPKYKGPVVRGLVVAGIEVQDDGDLVFVNETWMWRREGDALVVLEGRLGRWLHVLMSGWLVMKGVGAVMYGKGEGETEKYL